MAEEKRLAQQPMLYIVQPKLKPAEVPMQTSFRTQRKSVDASVPSAEPAAKETSAQEKETRMRRQQAPHVEELSKLKKEEEQAPGDPPASKAGQEEKRTPTSRERRQGFHELSLEEKVNYFFKLSPHVPKMKCEVKTAEEQYKGYITDYQDGMVHMKVFQRPFERTVPFADITDIRLLGF
ncbi:UNVERIFIED_CONTAM: CotO family spore coat protein [Halobacillus marinus]|uniref:CotO family spore coat protein n=1 Tax=Bacillus sp. SB49 TaxID=1071080 RepID=UPI000406C867|nr:CotO family spore coat protein [Bacillus sp. SB49]QHT46062.1 hypothetical protein M662_06005 [Bacillus sp. SB49]